MRKCTHKWEGGRTPTRSLKRPKMKLLRACGLKACNSWSACPPTHIQHEADGVIEDFPCKVKCSLERPAVAKFPFLPLDLNRSIDPTPQWPGGRDPDVDLLLSCSAGATECWLAIHLYRSRLHKKPSEKILYQWLGTPTRCTNLRMKVSIGTRSNRMLGDGTLDGYRF